MFLSFVLSIRFSYLQKLDHFNTHDNTYFNQSYFYSQIKNSQCILLYLGGLSEFQESILELPTLQELVKITNATLIGFEHRFFGKSKINNVDLKYLSIRQSLVDIDQFLEFIQSKFCSQNCTIGLIGNSYAGSIATWSRVRYPHLSKGAWASSAPLMFKKEFKEYDEFIADSFDKINCFEIMKNIYTKIDKIILSRNKEKIKNLKKSFGFSDTQDDISFLYVIEQEIANKIEKDNQEKVNICKRLKTNNSIDEYSKIFKEITKELNPQKLDPYLYEEGSDRRNKLWLHCNELGWFPVYSKLRSSLINISFFKNVCYSQFGINIDDISYEINNYRYGGSNPYLSKAIFSYGEYDPYLSLSLNTTLKSMGRIFYKIKNESVSSDIFNNSTNLNNVQIKIIHKMQKWIQNECENKCKYGECINGECVCDDMWEGDFCDSKVHLFHTFRIISSITVILPTIFMLVFSITAYKICFADSIIEKTSSEIYY